MARDFGTLQDIFRMITPADLLGAQRIALGTSANKGLLKEMLEIIYGSSGAGIMSADELSKRLTMLATGGNVDSATKDQFKRTLHLYKTGARCEAFGDSPFVAIDKDGKTTIENVDFKSIMGIDLEGQNPKKSMCVMLCNSGFLNPAVRNADKVELFLNTVPSVIASRMVPYLDVEFEFKRTMPDNKSSLPRHWTPGLLKFVMGTDQSLINDKSSPTAKMLEARQFESEGRMKSTAGMEMFTSPQTLVNPTPDSTVSGRYVDVLDPFRPFMSIESFTINVAPSVGFYTFKKASLVLKLHDRSRLNEIADLIRPQVYQDSNSAPTIWITYGWRHPLEPGNPYAEFINSSMLSREAYHVMNSAYSFDTQGQVTLTIELWTKGLPEMRTKLVSNDNDSSLKIVKEINEIAKNITRYRQALGIGPLEGVNKEIRGFMLIEAAERAAVPDMSAKEIQDALTSLKKSLEAPGAKLDKAAAADLLKELNKLYNPNDKKNYLNFKEQIKTQATSATNAKFEKVMTGPDPFLPTAVSDAKKKAKTKAEPSPLTSIVEALNAYNGEAEVKSQKSPAKGQTTGFRKKAASFGKLVSVFSSHAFAQIDGIDELQLYFYQFNENAGAAGGCNLAQFPIDMPVFLDQYRDHVEKKGSEQVTLEEFLRIVIDGQLHDPRAIGYGFRNYYAPYDPANKYDARLAKGIDTEKIEIAKRQFQMPAIEIYIETSAALTAPTTEAADLLLQYETSSLATQKNRIKDYTRVMRVHIFDKSLSPYKLPGKLVANRDGSFVEEPDKASVKQFIKDVKSDSVSWRDVIKNLSESGEVLLNTPGGISNSEIKHYVSKMMPSIIYGGNASMITNATLASKQDPLLATTQMQYLAKQGKPSVLSPNGSDVGGLPLRVIPAALSLTSMGCPLLTLAQQFFIDFNTGTSIDNVYTLTALQHTLTPGKFESQMTFAFYDAYGKFFGAQSVVENFKSQVIP